MAFWKVEVVSGVAADRIFRSWEMYSVTDVNDKAVTLPCNPKTFTLSEISQWIQNSQGRIEGETANKALLEQIKTSAEAIR